MTARLVALVAKTLLSSNLRPAFGFKACKSILLRMCLSLYRYPDVHACVIAKEVLGLLKLDDLKALSHEVTWWVLGDSSDCCLLSELLGKVPQKSALKQVSILQKPMDSKLNP